MNKPLIVFLAVCLICVHAYVKRDAPAQPTEKNYLEEIKKTFKEASDVINSKIVEAINPETLKKNFNEFVDTTNKLFDTPKKE